MQLMNKIKSNDKLKRFKFTVSMLNKIDENEGFFKNVMFTNEITFNISSLVNHHYC